MVFFSEKKNITFGSVCQNNDFFPENEQLKQGNYLHCFGKKNFQNLNIRIFFNFVWLYKGKSYLSKF